MGQFENYYGYISNEAESFTNEYYDEALDGIRDGDTNLINFIDDYRLHEWVDNDFIYVDLMDSAEILDQSDNVESDSGLWEGQEPEEAIKTKAFFTYRADLYFAVKDEFESKLNDELDEQVVKLDELQEQLKSKNDELNDEEDDDNIEEIEQEIEDLEEEITEVEQFIDYLEDAIEEL